MQRNLKPQPLNSKIIKKPDIVARKWLNIKCTNIFNEPLFTRHQKSYFYCVFTIFWLLCFFHKVFFTQNWCKWYLESEQHESRFSSAFWYLNVVFNTESKETTENAFIIVNHDADDNDPTLSIFFSYEQLWRRTSRGDCTLWYGLCRDIIDNLRTKF